MNPSNVGNLLRPKSPNPSRNSSRRNSFDGDQLDPLMITSNQGDLLSSLAPPGRPTRHRHHTGGGSEQHPSPINLWSDGQGVSDQVVLPQITANSPRESQGQGQGQGQGANPSREELFRRKLAFFFLDPVQKYHARKQVKLNHSKIKMNLNLKPFLFSDPLEVAFPVSEAGSGDNCAANIWQLSLFAHQVLHGQPDRLRTPVSERLGFSQRDPRLSACHRHLRHLSTVHFL